MNNITSTKAKAAVKLKPLLMGQNWNSPEQLRKEAPTERLLYSPLLLSFHCKGAKHVCVNVSFPLEVDSKCLPTRWAALRGRHQ